MNTEERAKIRTLLNYWIAHNKKHSQEFREWADGEAKEIAAAIKQIDFMSHSILLE